MEMKKYPEILYILAIVGQTKFLGVSTPLYPPWEHSWAPESFSYQFAKTDKKSESLKIMFMINR